MSKPVLSDEEIFATLERTLDFFYEQLPRYENEFYPEMAAEEARKDLPNKLLYQEHLKKLQEQGYDFQTSVTFLRAGYSRLFETEALKEIQKQDYNQTTAQAFFNACSNYLFDLKLLIRPGYYLNPKAVKNKIDVCMGIFSQYEKYIQGNHKRSLELKVFSTPPEKAPDSSPRFKPRLYLSGGK